VRRCCTAHARTLPRGARLNASAVMGSESPVSVARTAPPAASTSCASSPHAAASVRPSGDSRAAPPEKNGVRLASGS
jgi:hypothetical protein